MSQQGQIMRMIPRNKEVVMSKHPISQQALVDTLSTRQVRHGRGPNKFPSSRFVITVVNEVGDPTQPSVLVNAWKTSIGKLVRENVPVTYRFWKGKMHEEKYIVPDSIKQNLWDILMAKFELPNDCNMGLVRSRTLSNLGLSLRNFKSRMRPNLVGRIKCQTGINIHY
jgi:hypothetical protein